MFGEILQVLRSIDRHLGHINAELTKLTRESRDDMNAIEAAIADLTAQAHKTLDVEEAGVLTIKGLAQQLSDAINSGGNSATQVAAIEAIVVQMQSSSGVLGEAIANTNPSAPVPVPLPGDGVPPTDQGQGTSGQGTPPVTPPVDTGTSPDTSGSSSP